MKPELNTAAAACLIKRIVPAHAASFVIEPLRTTDHRNAFEIESRDGKIMLRGDNGVSVASALFHYLRHYAHCDLSWNGNSLQLPDTLPHIPQKIHITSPYKRRFYLNYVTFNYTMSWWDWERWEQEIDWMALHGINMPLALSGQSIIWKRVYNRLGLTDAELEDFFSGPAYTSWSWMGNLDGWNGPLPASWMAAQEALQQKILQRQRELGMTPVLAAFTGHVPPAFKTKYPDVKVRTTNWVNFPPVHVLDPSEPMFTTVGKMFIEEQTKTYGTDHLYSADTFNENIAPSSEPTYLRDVSARIYESMAAADPDAVWVMQAWMFVQDYLYWQADEIKAVLTAIPDNKMIILDTFCETFPAWSKSKAFYGRPWIWNMLHNFGGATGMFGRMDEVANIPAGLLKDPEAGNLTGIGVMPEGLEQNPVMYQLMLDNVWRDQPIVPEQWLADYARRRYGKENEDARIAWMILWKTAYNGGLTYGTPKSIICARPTFKASARVVDPHKVYKDEDFFPVWERFVMASAELCTEGFEYDFVDVTRQALANYADALQRQFTSDFEKKDQAAFKIHSSLFLEIINDLDRLLAANKHFLLGTWLNAAKKRATNAAEAALFERNARNLITLWGDKECWLNDYTARQWNGMMKGFYMPRWQRFIHKVHEALETDQHFDNNAFENEIREWEWSWIHGNEEYIDQPEGDAIEIAHALYRKYNGLIVSS